MDAWMHGMQADACIYTSIKILVIYIYTYIQYMYLHVGCASPVKWMYGERSG
jgi:hypothetical protein